MYAYNPRNISPGRLESSLVGADRWDALNSILEEMALEPGQGPKQHWMLVGPRGIGKSHLMTLLYHKLKKSERLSRVWIPLLFPEELRIAGNLARFLERAVREMILEVEPSKDPVYEELKQKLETVRKSPMGERPDHFFSLISWFHGETGKIVALLAENLQQLLGKKIPLVEQKKLRAFLQTSNALLVIGSATTIFKALHDHSHPFFHFFHLVRLRELSFEDMKALIVNLLVESKRSDLVKELHAIDPRIQTLYSFTGGNPRIAVFLADILKTEVPDEMLELMDQILDQLTPYFDSIFKDIPGYLEDVLNTLAAFEPAQSPKEIAQRLESPPATIRNYLKQLKESGHVRVAFSKGKSNYYCLTEYLYRIWYQMRDSGHREETRWLMEFLLMLHSPGAITEKKNRLETNGHDEEGDSIYNRLLIQTADFIKRNPNFCNMIELCFEFNNADNGEDEEETEHEDEGDIACKKEKNLLIEAVIDFFNQQYDSAINKCKDVININPNSEYGLLLWGNSLMSMGQFDESIGKFKKALKISPKSNVSNVSLTTSLLFSGQLNEAINQIKQFKPNLKIPQDLIRYMAKLEKIDEKQAVIYQLAGAHPSEYVVCGLLGLLLDSINNKEGAILNLMRQIDIGFKLPHGKFNLKNIYIDYIDPALKKLKPAKYIKRFFDQESDISLSNLQIAMFLVLLGKYDIVFSHMSDFVESYKEERNENADFSLLMTAIKICVWLRLSEGKIEESFRILDLYITYIKLLEKAESKNGEMFTFFIFLSGIQDDLNLNSTDTLKILSRFEKIEDLPIIDPIMKIWKCISEPESIDAKRYLNEKAIAGLVKEIKNYKML